MMLAAFAVVDGPGAAEFGLGIEIVLFVRCIGKFGGFPAGVFCEEAFAGVDTWVAVDECGLSSDAAVDGQGIGLGFRDGCAIAVLASGVNVSASVGGTGRFASEVLGVTVFTQLFVASSKVWSALSQRADAPTQC